jgi:nifR3 family TIM-barrel protein
MLAPLAGYSDSAMRRISRQYGAAMVFSEMLSGEGARRNSKKTFRMAAFAPAERPYFVQFFATNPEQAADAARVLSELEPDGLDLNFGCPVKKIILNQGGAALLKDVKLIAQIVRTAVQASNVPVSVKMRSGWDHRSLNAVEVARAVADAGAAWVTVHARTRSEFFQGKAHWEWIGEVKAAVDIPVIGNGDVRTAQDVVDLMALTECDAAMIGRAAIGYPFIFREVNSLLQNGIAMLPPTPRERLSAIQQHYQWMVEQWGERRAVCEFRKHLLAYVKGLPNSARFRNLVVQLKLSEQVMEATSSYLTSLPDEPVARSVSDFDGAPVWE